MPTISAELDANVATGDLSVKLSGQTGQLMSTLTMLADLIADPPDSIADFAAALGSVELPEIDVAGDLGPALDSLADALPDDLPLATAELLSICLSLGVKVGDELVPQVEKLVHGIEALGALIQRARDFGASADAGAEIDVSGGGVSGGGTSAGGVPTTPADDRRAERTAAIAQVNAALDAVPASLDAGTVVELAQGVLSSLPREIAGIPYVPVLDNLLYLLATTVELKHADAAGLEKHIRSSADRLALFLVSAGRGPVDALVARLTELAPHVRATELKTHMDALIQGCSTLAAAVDSGDVAATGAVVGAMNAAVDQLLPVLASIDADLSSGGVDSAVEAFARLPSDMEAGLRRIAHAAVPPGYTMLIAGAGAALQDAVQASGIDELVEGMSSAFEDVLKGLDHLDLASQLESVTGVVESLNAAVAEIEAGLSNVATKISAAFDDLMTMIDSIDLAAVTAEVKDALDSFVDDLRKQVDALFEPVRSALATAVSELSGVISSFDPKEVVAAVKKAINDIAAVLSKRAIVEVAERVKQTLDGVARDLESVSFEPVTDQVVAAIDEITAALNAIKPEELSPATKIALSAAVMILPSDLDPLTDPLEDQFTLLVESGPMPLLDLVKDEPTKLLDRVRLFSPEALIGSQLSEPFEHLISELEAFTPTSLLKPVTDAVANLKSQLLESADPAVLVEPLKAPFEDLKATINAIDPNAFIAPLQNAIDGAVDAVLAAVPLDAAFGALDDLIEIAGDISESLAAIKTFVSKTRAIAAGLVDPKDQLTAWLKPVIDRVDDISSLSGIQVSMNAVANALDDLGSNALASLLGAALDPVSATLTDLAPGDLLRSFMAAYRKVSPSALQPSLQKDAITALLARLDPLDPDFTRPFLLLEEWSGAITRDRAAWEEFLPLWAQRVAESHAPLQGLRHPSVTKQELKAILKAGLEDEIITPLGGFLALLGDAAESISKPAAELEDFADQLITAIDAVAAGPAALTSLEGTLTSVGDAIKDLDLQFIADALHEVFADVVAKLDTVDPDAVAALLTDTFQSSLDAIDPLQLLPATALAKLDADYEQMVTKLKTLDPTKLVIDLTMPIFEEKVIPLLEAFDLTAVIEALIATLENLEGELDGELERVNVAYKKMLDAVPTISPLDLDIDIEVDVSIGS